MYPLISYCCIPIAYSEVELPKYLSYASNMFHPIRKHKRLTYINLWYLYQLIYTELPANGTDEVKHAGDITKIVG